eukprot:1145112-Pelagomonas_calceolata.AAC.3
MEATQLMQIPFQTAVLLLNLSSPSLPTLTHLDLALDLADLSVHADGGNTAHADAIGDGRAGKEHVLLGLQLALSLGHGFCAFQH